MELVFLALGALVVVAVAVVAVAVAVGRLEREARPAVYDLADAVEYVADRLPDEIQATLGYDDVRTVLTWHLDWFAAVGLASRHGRELGDEALRTDDDVVVDEAAAVDALVARTLAEDGPDPVAVVCILDLQMRYLEGIGGLGRQ